VEAPGLCIAAAGDIHRGCARAEVVGLTSLSRPHLAAVDAWRPKSPVAPGADRRTCTGQGSGVGVSQVLQVLLCASWPLNCLPCCSAGSYHGKFHFSIVRPCYVIRVATELYTLGGTGY
jgi:hypothetical protein